MQTMIIWLLIGFGAIFVDYSIGNISKTEIKNTGMITPNFNHECKSK